MLSALADPALLEALSDGEKATLIALLEAKLTEFEQRGLYRYQPYPKQAEFHRLGGDPAIRERALVAANQVGKTLCAGCETAYHLTGDYPSWWNGATWDYPPAGWAGSVTAQGTRDSVQRILIGKPGAWGTGTIPGERIVDIKRAAGSVPDCIDNVTIRHATGGLSRLSFRYYEQGREKWQSESLDLIWLDEEPPEDIYTEALTRTNATEGIIYLTFTPLLGMSKVVKRFLREHVPGTAVVSMSIDDALHYTPAQRAAIIAAYPEHEREARTKGIPLLGSGLIYPVAESVIKVPAFAIPPHWVRICGLDFGWDHPTAAAWLAWNRDNDVVYLHDTYKARLQIPVIHAAAIKARGAWIPIAWPHDGVAHDKGGGEPLATQYRKLGCAMLPEKATHAPAPGEAEGTGGYSVEAGVLDILERMQTGRFKVFDHLNDFFEETRLYHRDNGKIVKEDDDLCDAVRGGIMMLRHAKVRPITTAQRKPSYHPTDPGAGY